MTIIKPANWPTVTVPVEAFMKKLADYNGQPKAQLAIIDYWIGSLFVLRSEIEHGNKITPK